MKKKERKAQEKRRKRARLSGNALRALGKKLHDDDDSFFLFLKMIGLGASFPLTPSST